MNNCKVCETAIGNSRVYCSDRCKEKHRYRNTIYIKNCKICGEEFPATKGMSTCSPECSLRAQRNQSRICPMCNKEFDSRGNGVYCSEVCYRTANSETKGLMVSKCEVCNCSFKTPRTSPRDVCGDVCSSKLLSTYIDRSHREVFGTSNLKEINEILTNRRISCEN